MQEKRNLAILAILVAGISLSACKSSNKPTHVIPQIPVVEVIGKDVPLKKEFVGQIYGYYDIPIRARVEGWLQEIRFNEGTAVTKGQVLYRIDPEPFQADVNASMSQLAEARTMLAKAESDYNRYKPLAEINAVSQSDLDFAKAQYEASLASVEAAQANLDLSNIRLSYSVIKAPITGLIGKTKAKVGEFVGKDPNPVILNTVSQIDTVRVEFFLTEADYLTLARAVIAGGMAGPYKDEEGDSTRILRLKLADGTFHKYPGKFDFIDREISTASGTILIQASFPNPDRLLRPGQFARVEAVIETITGALLIPQRAVSEIQGQYRVLIVNADSTISNRTVSILSPFMDYYVVSEGLELGDKIVFEGLQKVTEGARIQPVLTEFKSKQDIKP